VQETTILNIIIILLSNWGQGAKLLVSIRETSGLYLSQERDNPQ
jgi:hypothetical protein